MSRLASFSSGSENRQRLNSVLIAKTAWVVGCRGPLFYICKVFFFSFFPFFCLLHKHKNTGTAKEGRTEGCVKIATVDTVNRYIYPLISS